MISQSWSTKKYFNIKFTSLYLIWRNFLLEFLSLHFIVNVSKNNIICFLFKNFFFRYYWWWCISQWQNDEKIMISVLAACYWLKKIIYKQKIFHEKWKYFSLHGILSLLHFENLLILNLTQIFSWNHIWLVTRPKRGILTILAVLKLCFSKTAQFHHGLEWPK